MCVCVCVCVCVVTYHNVFNVWPRDAKRLDTPVSFSSSLVAEGTLHTEVLPTIPKAPLLYSLISLEHGNKGQSPPGWQAAHWQSQHISATPRLCWEAPADFSIFSPFSLYRGSAAHGEDANL